jgi:hypothetical protein
MKRRPALRQLSREHHGALILALRITRARDATTVAHLMATVPDVFAREFEPHFRDEDSFAGLVAKFASLLTGVGGFKGLGGRFDRRNLPACAPSHRWIVCPPLESP